MTITELPQVHTGRWRPHRAGIVNIWRYLDEVFGFHRGRLLLRGANGTGKSKALELLLPYLLDANLRAHRLSTFGSDRSMHWNLMGDGYPNATRVGYVWLEFARTDPGGTERFFTCGARLQATTSSTSVSATYFTTTQRVGHELHLVRAGRPLTRADLATALGPHGRTYEQATEEYRATLRTTLFPGVTREKYEALIVALLQLRTPKLSEHLDPDELSGLLSRSLPPVDADDVAEIAEGFERLDRHAEQVQALAGEAAAARRLAEVARRYARRVLRAAADRLIKATSAMDAVTRRARTSATALADAEQQLAGVRTADGELAAEHRELAARAEGIQLLDAYQEGKQLPTLRADTTEARRRAEAAVNTAARAAGTAGQDAATARTARDEAAAATETAGRSRERAADAAESVGRGALAVQLAGTEDLRRARRLLEAGLSARLGDVETVQRALSAHSDAVRDHTGAEQRRETAQEEHTGAQHAARDAAQAYTAAVAALAEELTGWAGRCRLLELLALAPAPVELAVDAIADALDGAVLSRDDLHEALRRRLPAELLPWCPGCRSHHARRGLLVMASLRGRLCVAGRVGRQPAFARTDQWLGWDPPAPTDARAQLVERYLSGYGPSTPEHFAEWAGLGTAHARALWMLVADRLAEVRLGGRTAAWLLVRDLPRLQGPAEARGVRLLGAGDPLLLGRDRERLVPDELVRKRIWTAIGGAGLVIADGAPVALWRGRKNGRRLVVSIEAFAPLSREALRAQAERLAPHRGCANVAIEWS